MSAARLPGELAVYIAVEPSLISLLVDAPSGPWSLVGRSLGTVSEYQLAHDLLSRVALHFSAARFVVHTDDLVLFHAFTGEFDFYTEVLPFPAWRGLCGETGSAIDYVRVSSRTPHPWQVLARERLELARTMPPGGSLESLVDWA